MNDITVGSVMQASGGAFGTSGARGEVGAMMYSVCYTYARGFLAYLQEIGEFTPGTDLAFAGDLRPSTPRSLSACARAIRDSGGEPVFCGHVPTPALALFAFSRGIPSLMVTERHIPADRNGIKFYRPRGEVLKSDEAGMCRQRVGLALACSRKRGRSRSPRCCHRLPMSKKPMSIAMSGILARVR